ncbi:EAL domain-containing protein [Exilibacterium tricleocarpae]|uniref:cyclic-guanylate-specific phosphodiesterase n=1 Tax=Exilibacterium tricleocarpae TaxID=2591008 RepID=A0A545U9Z2_9GAMM|nr:bifunctional diguanylate cyclase/phosphodiesterase [Exilibacterium tricleocarpae]TQV86295.1 EAL domain-containing protein [Exilibacterium tricleocarpae]
MADTIEAAQGVGEALSQNYGEQQLLRLAMSTIGAIAWQWDLDSGVFSYSLPLAQALGLDSDGEDTSLLDRIDREDQENLLAAAERAHEGREAFEHLVHIRIGPEYHPFRIIGSRVDSPLANHRSMSGILMAGVDAGFLLNSILSHTSVLVFVKDLQGHYLFVNPEYAQQCGIDAHDALGKTDRELFGDKVADYTLQLEQRVIESAEQMQREESPPFQTDNTYLAERFPIYNSQGAIYALGCVFTDITQNKTYEQTINQQRRELGLVLDAVPSQIWYLGSGGEVIAINRQASRLLGLDIKQVKDRTLLDLSNAVPNARERHRQILQVIETGTPVFGSIENYLDNGERVWARVDTIPMPGKGGEISGVLLVANDVTELKRKEEHLARNDARYRSFIANSTEAIFGAEVEPPMPLNLQLERQIDWLKQHTRYIECNKICASSYDLEIDEFIGSRLIDLESSKEVFRQKALAFLQNRYRVSNISVCELDRFGNERWYELSLRGQISREGLTEIWGMFRDVTVNKRQELALKHSESRYRSFIANSHEGIFNLEFRQSIAIGLPLEQQVECFVRDTYVSECNDVFAQQYGYESAAECVGRGIMELSDAESARKMLRIFIKNNYQLANFESQVRSKHAGVFWSSASLEGVIENDMLVGCWGSQRDTTERRKYLEELEYQATHDSLTLLPNRKKLYMEAEASIRNLHPDKSLALMLIDLDRFKEINDTLGHHMGDRLLKQLGPRLELIISEHPGLVARLGGDEFAVMLANIAEQEATEIAHQILLQIGETFDLGGFQADISASLGISFCPKHGQDVGTLMRYADVAMYRAKTESIGMLEYAPAFDKHTPKRLALMTDLGRAIREDQLLLHFQPKIDVNGRFIHGFEALLRWEHPQHGAIPPSEFIPLAETTELIRPLTLWVLDAAMAQCRRWRGAGLNVRVAVNLSTRNLLDDQIVNQVERILANHQVPAHALELEITESAIMADPKRALEALERVHALGVHLSIDDFGTGYSSLAYIKRLPVETLKIDYSFVIDMLEDEQDEIIVRSTINLAHNLGLKVVAEGVESRAILEKLYGMGCDQAQGYYIGRPMTEADAGQWLRRGEWSSLHLLT